MSSITTDSLKFHQEIKKLLTGGFDSGWTPLWSYCEMTHMLIYGFAFTFLIKGGLQASKLLYRKWNNGTPGLNPYGIFDLSSIKIDEEEVSISLNDIFEIQEMIKTGVGVTESNKIVLDGYHMEFVDFKTGKKLTWNLDSEMNPGLSTLARKIRKLKIL